MIDNVNGSIKPQIVKKSTNGYPTPVHLEAQNDKKERGKAFRQIVAAFIANIGPMNTGLIFGFSAVVIPQLQSPASSIQIDENQASWIGELCFLIAGIELEKSLGNKFMWRHLDRFFLENYIHCLR